MTTFDRYLLRRFLHVFTLGFLATFGLFVVIDAFSNVDGFQDAAEGAGADVVLANMAQYYLFQSILFFDLVGPILVVISVVVVFAMLYRKSEIYPILSAGVRTYRLVVPLILGTFLINLLLIGNQEFVIPRISHQLAAPRGSSNSHAQNVEPVRDFKTQINIYGDELYLADRKLRGAEFVLPGDRITSVLTTLKAREAFYRKGRNGQPSGWLLRDVSPRFDHLKLTNEGTEVIRALKNPNDVFVVSDVTFDQLHNRSVSYKFISTPELIRRIRNPAFGLISVRSLTVHLHERLTRPLMIMLAVLVAVPLVVRKESRSLITSVAMCTLILGLIHLTGQAFLYLGKVNLVTAELAAWSPVMMSGTLGAWLSGIVQT